MLDVCILVDGSYPYSGGGIAGWVHELVTGLSMLRFGIVHVGVARDMPRESSVPIPDNVERLVEVFPQEPEAEAGSSPSFVGRLLRTARPERREAFATLEAFYDRLLVSGDLAGEEEALHLMAGGAPARLTIEDLLGSREAWDVFVRLYEAHAPERPYLDSFRTWRAIQTPLLRALRAQVPAAHVYHAVSTGYAGLLGTLASMRSGAPLIVTESGDPAEARAMPGLDRATQEVVRDLFRRAVYRRAAAILTFTETALRAEVRRGAPAERCRVVPDGLDVTRFAGLRGRGKPTAEKETLLVALVAPVLPEKDVKTFLRAAKLLIERLDLVEVIVVGRTDANLAYHRECLLQAQMLGIDRMVRFPGPVDTRELLAALDCLVLTSSSEGSPVVLLEAMAAGVPAVATDTGGCRELLEGRFPEDRALGASGIVCPVGDHEAIAEAVKRCVRDHALRERMVAAGRARVERYYRREDVHGVHRELYERLRDGGEHAVRAALEALEPTLLEASS
ncbi:MAG TPA: GT4 family glycosyltransferase PelF [Planctomycetota bacterium]|nr:GT4 family glycosyltransferase PelF [Planctomycetota bacterium]